MAVENEIFIIAVAIMFTYLVIYPKSKILGNITYIAYGVALMAYSTENTYAAIGLIITLASIINTILDLLPKKTEGKTF